jgi:hypothetical protein
MKRSKLVCLALRLNPAAGALALDHAPAKTARSSSMLLTRDQTLAPDCRSFVRDFRWASGKRRRDVEIVFVARA